MLSFQQLFFIGYLLIEFAFRGNFVYGDMTDLAIAIDGAFSKILQFATHTKSSKFYKQFAYIFGQKDIV